MFSYAESKYAILNCIDAHIRSLKSDHKDYQLLFLTPYGIITCDVEYKPSTELTQLEIDSFGHSTIDFSHAVSFYNEHAPEESRIDESVFLYVTNASIYKNSLKEKIVSIGKMFVFVDQIIGVSIVPRAQLQNV